MACSSSLGESSGVREWNLAVSGARGLERHGKSKTGDAGRGVFVRLLRWCADLLLRVLVLVVLGVAGAVVLRLGIVAGVSALAVSSSSLTAPGRSGTSTSTAASASTVAWRRSVAVVRASSLRAVATSAAGATTATTALRVRRNSALPHLGTPPRGDV